MNFENVPQKHMNELELLVRELLAVMRKAKLQNESLEQALRQFEQELEDARRKRFDAVNSEYHTY
jgi:Zn-dependent M16 (insulinase) family peptidase